MKRRNAALFIEILLKLGFAGTDVFSSRTVAPEIDPEDLGRVLVGEGILDSVRIKLALTVLHLTDPENPALDLADLHELLLGAAAVHKGILLPLALSETVKDLRAHEGEGEKPDLLQLLAEKGLLAPESVDEIRRWTDALLGLEDWACPACGVRFPRRPLKPGTRFRCGRCKEILVASGEGKLEKWGRAGEPGQSRDRAASSSSTGSGTPASGSDGASVAAPESLPATGDRVGAFTILREIGHGGMGVVYHARDEEKGLEAAVKVMLAGDAATKGQLRRFEREIRNMSKLEHPGILRILDVGKTSGRRYYAMEFIEGGSLKDLVKIHGGALEPRKAAEIMIEAAQAVSFAHEREIIHRDLKPENVLLDTQERVKLADFGLAKDLGSDALLTREGSSLGTPAYIPPEQAQGKLQEIDARSDVYSLGAILYELLTGEPPFWGSTRIEILVKVVETEPPRPRARNRKIPREIEAICMTAMAKRKRERYPTAGAFIEDLRGFLEGRKIEAKGGILAQRVKTSASRWARNIAAAFIVLTFLLGLLAGLGLPLEAERKVGDAEREALLQEARAAFAAGKDDVGAGILSRIEAVEKDAALAETGAIWRAHLLAVRGGEKEIEKYRSADSKGIFAEEVGKARERRTRLENAGSALKRAGEAKERGDWEAALGLARKALEDLGWNPRALRIAAEALRVLGVEAALETAEKELSAGAPDKAMEEALKALAIEEGNREAEALLARIKEQLGQGGAGKDGR